MCLFKTQSSILKINKILSKDLKQLSFCLNANRKSLSVAKTKVTLFKPKNKQLDTDIKLKVCTKRLYTTNLVRCLGILIDDKLN